MKRRKPTVLEWNTILETAKKEARAIGGNGLEVQYRGHFSDSLDNYYAISAFILNINDSIQPTVPKAFDKIDFHDYIITKEGDSVPCHMTDESDQYLALIPGYNREGYRKGVILPKSDILSYQIEDHKAMEKAVEEFNNNYYNSFKIMLAVDGGWLDSPSRYKEKHSGFYGTGKMLFNIKNGLTLGVHYSRYNIKGIKLPIPFQAYHPIQAYQAYHYHDKVHYIACSIGSFVPTVSVPDQYLDFYPSLKYRKGMLSLQFQLGYLSYVEESEMGIVYHNVYVNRENYILTKEGLGIGLHFGFDRMLTKHLGIGIGDGLFFELPLKATIIEGESAIPEEAMKSHFSFNITAGLHYYL